MLCWQIARVFPIRWWKLWDGKCCFWPYIDIDEIEIRTWYIAVTSPSDSHVANLRRGRLEWTVQYQTCADRILKLTANLRYGQWKNGIANRSLVCVSDSWGKATHAAVRSGWVPIMYYEFTSSHTLSSIERFYQVFLIVAIYKEVDQPILIDLEDNLLAAHMKKKTLLTSNRV